VKSEIVLDPDMRTTFMFSVEKVLNKSKFRENVASNIYIYSHSYE
jgi:hypothetical protein